MKKIKIAYFLFFISFVIILGKLFYIQVLKRNNYYNNYLKTRKIPAERGRIFDRNGYPLAVNQTKYLLYVEPNKIENIDQAIKKINQITNIDEATLEGRLSKEKQWASVKVIDREQKKLLEKEKIKGVGFEERFARYYPEASLSAHILGFVGKDYQGENTGYFGIEGYYNKDLAGMPGILKTERNLSNMPILIGVQEKVDPENGRDIYLTIDKVVQKIAKQQLKVGIEKYQADRGCVIVADPKTMEIIALSCLPDFSPTSYYKFSEDYFRNPSISDTFEPGSIFKPLIVASALQEKKIKPNDTYNETGPIIVGKYKIKTWNNKYHGEITITQILENSSNVGMVYIGRKLGKDNIYNYLKKFGFDKKTNIDLQGETIAHFRPKNKWYPIDYDTVTFGQGVAVTPIQIIKAFASLINGGELMRPYVVKKIKGRNTQEIKPKKEKRVISKMTSEIIKKMLVSTVQNGEVKHYAPKDYQIGGKTGTAQIAIAGHYDSSKTVASFIGFAPYKNPKFIILVSLKEPKTSPWGSETAAPIFFKIANQLFIYYNISPE